jgi:hypothetical protein
VVIRPNGANATVRFDTTLACGRDRYQIDGTRTSPITNGHVTSRGHSYWPLRAGRVTYSWTLEADLGGQASDGVLTLKGKRRTPRGTTSCNHSVVRPFRVRADQAPAGPASGAQAGAAYLGRSDMTTGGGLHGSVVVRVARAGTKVAARWTAAAPCSRGPKEILVNFTPGTPIASDGSFARTEHFSQRFSDALVRYRVRFAGRFLSDGAGGTVRMRARIFDVRGRHLQARCDSGDKAWHAMLDGAAPSPAAGAPTSSAPSGGTTGTSGDSGSTPSTTTGPYDRKIIPASTWSLTLDSNEGDYIAQGKDYSYATGDGQMTGSADPYYVGFMVRFPDNGWWDGDFSSEQNPPLAAGTTYTIDTSNSNRAYLHVGGMGRGCNRTSGSFTIDQLVFDPNGQIHDAKIRFEQYCEGYMPPLRGTWEFHA